jgi:hypothetical protein
MVRRANGDAMETSRIKMWTAVMTVRMMNLECPEVFSLVWDNARVRAWHPLPKEGFALEY